MLLASRSEQRIELSLTGLVQGVGFRPHVYRLAKELRLNGWVINSAQGVIIQLEGPIKALEAFMPRLEAELPAHAKILDKKQRHLETTGETGFEIRKSSAKGDVEPLILPDIAVCPECQEELFNFFNRRFRYPFINCTHCGPRFSIVDALPYDRPNTSMRSFALCPDCEQEYQDPLDRRFHAQPNACRKCGPQLSFHKDDLYDPAATQNEALEHAIDELKRGEIIALKGLGGFQLVVDATQPEAVQRLRKRKRRGDKPFAIMFPNYQEAAKFTYIDEDERKLLESPEAPIVLVEKKNVRFEAAAPRNPYLGVFLPYTPLHHLLLHDIARPLIVTSGNLANEPICIDNKEAFERLVSIADCFLVHDRPIQRAVDDSVVRMVADKLQILRRARGYAPLPIRLKQPIPSTLAVGGYLKNTIAVGKGRQIILSQHIGNLDTRESIKAFETTIHDFQTLYQVNPETVVTDLHPDYISTQLAKQGFSDRRILSVQHHFAHVLSTMAEHSLEPPLLGISWDGTGYGTDGTIWGAESFLVEPSESHRVASIVPFRLPGGEAAIKDTRRIALSLRYVAGCEWEDTRENGLLVKLIQGEVRAPLCSSMGRLFDGVSSMLGLCDQVHFEGEAAMLLEFAASQSSITESYALHFDEQIHLKTYDWRPMITCIDDELAKGLPVEDIARKFHNTLASLILKIADQAEQSQVVLTGGCFQNKLLTELAIDRLTQAQFQVYTHNHIPPNDGGLAAGQVYACYLNTQLKP